MRIVRYMAPDTRQALRGIREQLGDDAVILSSKRTPEGVEVTAAVDFDATRLESESTVLAPQPRPQPKPAPAPPSESSGAVTAKANVIWLKLCMFMVEVWKPLNT